jgi:hypothetical protein
MKTVNRIKRPDTAALKERYLDCIGLTSVSTTALQGVVAKLLNLGISRKTLVNWAVRKGYSRGSAANLLTRICKALGFPERQPGAGRIPSPDTLELLAHARTRYGERAINLLRSAWRTGKAQAKSGSGGVAPQSGIAKKPPIAPPLCSLGANNGPIIRRYGKSKAQVKSGFGKFPPQSGIARKPPVAPPSRSLGANNGSIIRRNGHAANRDTLSVRQPAGMILKRTGNTTRNSRNQTLTIQI